MQGPQGLWLRYLEAVCIQWDQAFIRFGHTIILQTEPLNFGITWMVIGAQQGIQTQPQACANQLRRDECGRAHGADTRK